MIKYLKNNTLFVPTKEIHWNALDDPEFNVKDINLYVNNERVHGWYFEPTRDESIKYNKVILFLHGNYGNISCRREIVDLIVNVCQMPLLIFDYRGYGQSEGKATLDHIKEDSEVMYNYLIDHLGYSHDQIILWGKSMGGYGATHLASMYPVDVLVLMYTFSTFSGVMQDKKLFSMAVDQITNDVSNNLDHIQHCKASKTIFIHSKTDGFIPYECSLELYDHLNPSSEKHFVTISGTHGHPIITESEFNQLVPLLNISQPSSPLLHQCLKSLEDIKLLQPDDI